MKKQVVLIVMCLSAIEVTAQTEVKRVLFVGNSYIYTNDMPAMVRQMAESVGDEIEYEQVTPGGASFMTQCNSTGAMTSICAGGWDVVVLQGQSQEPSFPWSQFMGQTFPYACRLADSVYANNECAEVMYYMTWGRKNGDASNAPYFDSLATYEGMDNLLYERYMYMGRMNNASVCPAGRVWRKLREDHPEMELYSSDESHPSVIGTYAVACAFYTMLFRKDPTLITTDLTLSAADAQVVREATKAVVYDTMWKYSCHAFLAAQQSGDSSQWQFECLSAVEPEVCQWEFGDGESSTELSTTHTYGEAGTYMVRLVAGKACQPDTMTIEIEVTAGGSQDDPDNPTGNIEQAGMLVVSYGPNPAVSQITICVAKPTKIQIVDVNGVPRIGTEVTDKVRIEVSEWPNGVYLIIADGHCVGKVIKR